MAANDAVDGATLPHRECYSGYLGAIVIHGGETATGEVTELARTVRRNADKVVLAIGRTRVGHRTLKCVLTIGTRSAQSIMASGHSASQTGRTHDRTRPMLQPRQKVLAKAPSTHDPKRTLAENGGRAGDFSDKLNHSNSTIGPPLHFVAMQRLGRSRGKK